MPVAPMLRQVARRGLASSASSKRYLARQDRDRYVKEAREQGYRSRSALKLKQLDLRLQLFRRGSRVVDLGAAPGGWSQVAVEAVSAERVSLTEEELVEDKPLRPTLRRERLPEHGVVVAVDRDEFDDVPGAVQVIGDMRDEAVQRRVRRYLDGHEADVVLSDMAPNTTGNKLVDHERMMQLAEEAAVFAEGILRTGGVFLCKIFQGGSEKELMRRLQDNFLLVKVEKPRASRKESSEMYIHASGFVPPYLSQLCTEEGLARLQETKAEPFLASSLSEPASEKDDSRGSK